MKNSVHYKAGSKNEIAVILSCPGQVEESAIPPEPAKGQTGKNLETILEILTKDYEHDGFTRDEICITNSWDKAIYPSKTNNGKSETTSISQILSSKNLDRLAKEVGNVEKTIICCGVNAEAVILALSYAKKLHKNVTVIFTEHLGNKALNSNIKKDLKGADIKRCSTAKDKPIGETRSLTQIEHDNHHLRLQVVAKQLHDQIKK
jgi:hypothetical protein